MGQALTRQGYTPVLAPPPGGSSEDELTEMLVDRDVSGIVYVSGLHSDTSADMGRYEQLRAKGVPFVLVDGFSPDVRAPFISPDDRAAMRLAVTHLVSLGHQMIGLAVGPQRFVPVIRKIEGFLTTVRELLGPSADDPEKLIQQSLFTLEGGQAADAALIGRRMHGGGVRERHDGARCDQGREATGARGPAGCVGDRLRRLPAHGVHRSTADHDP